MGEPGIQQMTPPLNISNRAAQHLQEIHKSWGLTPASLDILHPQNHITPTLETNKHTRFFLQCLKTLSGQYAIADTSR